MRNKAYNWKPVAVGVLFGLGLPLTASAQATEYDGVVFPHGDESFADSVVHYAVDDEGVGPNYADPEAALGPPDYNHAEQSGAVALGNAVEGEPPGELIVAFDSNRLVDVEGNDLYIFEVGPAVEACSVAISIDGDEWFEVGTIEGSTRGIDLADHPNVPADRGFRYVRIRDVPDGETSGYPSAGPDIDAVGAIGSVDAGLIDEDGRFLPDDTGHPADGGETMDCDGCSSAPGLPTLSWLLLAVAALRRRR